jgi:hypothetical protein
VICRGSQAPCLGRPWWVNQCHPAGAAADAHDSSEWLIPPFEIREGRPPEQEAQ